MLNIFFFDTVYSLYTSICNPEITPEEEAYLLFLLPEASTRWEKT